MPLHPQAEGFLSMVASWGRPQRHMLTPAENREGMRLMIPYQGEQVSLARVEDRTVPGPGGEIAVRVYVPVEAAEALPGCVYFHGGGWVIGGLDEADRTCRNLAKLAGCVVISVDYRLAPEHRFPAAVDDSAAVTQHVAAHPEAYGVDPNRIAVGGESAGGNLAAVVAQLARSHGPSLRHQLLIYPVVDTDLDRPTYREFTEGYYLTRADMGWYLDHYLAGGDTADPRVAPLRAPDLSGLPPATIIAAEYDVLRDEGDAYARALTEAGVPVSSRRFSGVFHAFFGLAGVLDAAGEAQAWAAERLREAFATVEGRNP
ncbi:MAG: alpha/beta hydrolase fold domain-containing protein [Streptosporangiales bacterium]|nr:alpha/beta hydrolase fold domain-containing protein [Streptosporangiales bacterium]